MPDFERSFAVSREYLTVRPTTDPLVASHAATTLRTIHGAASTETPAVEMLLVTAGAEEGVSYLFGAVDGTTDRLEQALRRCFPTEYELARTTTSLATLLGVPSEAESGADAGDTGDESEPEGAGDTIDETGDANATDAPPLEERSIAGLELQAQEERVGDWRTRLRRFATFSEEDQETWPLAGVVDALAGAACPVVLQTLLVPAADWTAEADLAVKAYRDPSGNLFDQLLDAVFLDPELDDRERSTVPPERRARIEEIEAVNTRRSFYINARAIGIGDRGAAPATALNGLDGAFAEVGRTTYQLTTTRYDADTAGARALAADLATRTPRRFSLGRRIARALDITLPGVLTATTNPRIVADSTTASSFCLLGGATLAESAQRAIGTRPGERTGTPLPPPAVLDEYHGPGYTLGRPQTGDRVDRSEPIALPPALQRRHMLVAGRTGSGKSIWGVTGLLDNHAATEGATVIIESKDGRMADDYERAHYAEYGTLEDVYRFDAAECVPAMPFFDVRRQVESGVPRSQAVEDVTDHAKELLRTIMGAERYDSAVASPQVIEALIKALFDPVHGHDRFTLADLQRHTLRFADSGNPPPVIDDALRRELRRITATSEDTFVEIMSGAARRIAGAALDSRVAPLFNYAPDPNAESEHGPGTGSRSAGGEGEENGTGRGGESDAGSATGPQPFDWRARLDENCVVIIDTSELRDEPQRVVTLVVLSQLWTALQRRDAEASEPDDPGATLPLVNVHIEEAADIAASGILADLLQKGRSYDVGVTLSLQYPRQLKRADEAAYEEALNNIGTVVAGGVEHDRALAERLATDDMPPDAVATRLRGLAPGEWLVSLPAAFGATPPRPFQVVSGPLPPGHPEGPEPLSEPERATFAAARARRIERSRRYAIIVTEDATPVRASADTTAGAGPETDASPDAGAAAGGSDAAGEVGPTPGLGRGPLNTTLPFTRRLPETISYHAPSASVVCDACGTRHGRQLEAVLAAVDCHGDLDSVDRADVPTVHVGLTLSLDERAALEYTDPQLVFLQVVYNAHQQRYDRTWEYDIVTDGMDRLRAYAGLDDDAFDELVVDGLLSIDCDRPHVLYTVTAEGRDVIDAAHREGRAHGAGAGDLSESSMHVMFVEAMRRGFRAEFVESEAAPGTEVATYHPVEGGRLDVAVLDADGEVVVAGEAERENNDIRRAVPSDYDTMAATDPERAIWVVEGRTEGHHVIRALHDPPDGTPRVEKTYADTTALSRVTIDQPGFTDIYTINTFRKHFLDS